MNYTPLDVDKFRAQYNPPPSEPPTSVQRNFHFPLIAVFIVAITFIATIFAVTRFIQNPSVPKTEAEQLKPVPKVIRLVAATDATFSPMEYKNEKGEMVGYDIEFGQKLADEMGVEISFVHITWDDIFKSLEDNKVDMVIASVTITDDRKKQYLFSDPYLNAGQVVITRKTDTNVKSPYDLSGKKVGVQENTTNEDEAKKYTSPELVLTYENFVEASKDLSEGKVDAIFCDLPAAKGIITAHPDLKVSSDPFTDEYYGIVFRKDQKALQDKINSAITSLRQKGILYNLKEKYLN